MHANIENFLNNRDIAEAIPEFGQFLCFIDEVIKPRGIQPYRTEWRIAAPDLSLGGSVDFVGAKPDGTYVLMDWKRSKNLPTEINAAYGKLGK